MSLEKSITSIIKKTGRKPITIQIKKVITSLTIENHTIPQNRTEVTNKITGQDLNLLNLDL